MRTFEQHYKLPNKDSPSFSSKSKSAQRRPFVSFMGAGDRRRGNSSRTTGINTSTRESGTEKIGAGRRGMYGKERCGVYHFISIR